MATATQKIAEAVFGKYAPRPKPSWSSVDLAWRYGTPETGALVLKAAADHIYRQQDNGNPGNYQAVDLMDELRSTME